MQESQMCQVFEDSNISRTGTFIYYVAP